MLKIKYRMYGHVKFFNFEQAKGIDIGEDNHEDKEKNEKRQEEIKKGLIKYEKSLKVQERIKQEERKSREKENPDEWLDNQFNNHVNIDKSTIRGNTNIDIGK